MRLSRCLRQRQSSISHATRPHDACNALTQVFAIPQQSTVNGPLSGLSYVVKENICSALGATTCCSAILGAKTDEAYRSPFDATCVSLLNAAGAKLVGKTNMDEFGMGSFTTHSPYGPTLNPHRQDCTAGGSSGGSAAALCLDNAAGDLRIDFALGTDTGGSVRMPATYCGIYGFKPTYGRISRLGVVPYANSLDTVGILARKQDGLDIIRRVFEQLDHKDEQDPTALTMRARKMVDSLPVDTARRPLRIGIPEEYNVAELDPAVSAAWKSSLEHLSAQNCEIRTISLPTTQAALAAYYILAPSEVSSNMSKYSGVFYGTRAAADRQDARLYAATRSLFGAEVKRRILMGAFSLSSDRFDNYYLQAQRIRRLIVQDFNRVFAQAHALLPSRQGEDLVDYIVTPTATSSAPLLSDVVNMSSAETHAADVFTVPASMAGLPSISVPFAGDEQGMPIGIQIMGQYGDDRGVLDVAERLGLSC